MSKTTKTLEDLKREFIDMANKSFTFPARMKYSLSLNRKDKKQTISVSQLNKRLTDKKIENIKFLEVQSYGFFEEFATLSIKDCDTPEDLYDEVNHLSEMWCVK